MKQKPSFIKTVEDSSIKTAEDSSIKTVEDSSIKTVEDSPLWTTGTSEVRMTGTWRDAIPEYRTAPSPCRGACPVNGRIAEWVQQVKKEDYKGAWLTLVDNNPFPAIAGRICHHPCESACNRQQLDETVGICSLERFVGDMALAEGWQFPQPTVSCDESVAVVGGRSRRSLRCLSIASARLPGGSV